MIYPKEKIKTGTWFIDLNMDYDEVKLIFAGKNPKNNDILSVIWYNFPDDPTTIELDKYNGSIFPDLNGPWTDIFDDYIELREKFNSSKKELRLLIYSSPLKKVEVNEIINFYKNKYKVNDDIAKAFIKLGIVKADIKFERQKGGDFIKLSDVFLSIENKKRFLQSITDEIISISNRVELLIQHSQTKGNFRELLLRKVLEKYLPERYQVATGFIEGCKRQCDIIIYDKLNYSPLFREDDLVVVPAESVRAVIEVKTTLDTGELKEALDLLWDVARHSNKAAPIFKGIFAYKKGYESEYSVVNAICDFYHTVSVASTPPITNDILYLYETINSVCVLNEQNVLCDLIDYSQQDNTIRPRFYSVHSDNPELKIHSVSFFAELFSFLDVNKSAKKVNINYFDILNNEIKYKFEKALHENDWKPTSCFKNEHEFEFDSIWERVSDVINWKIGNYTTQELEEKYFKDKYQIVNYKERFELKNI